VGDSAVPCSLYSEEEITRKSLDCATYVTL
jgi:hypothetical protein